MMASPAQSFPDPLSSGPDTSGWVFQLLPSPGTVTVLRLALAAEELAMTIELGTIEVWNGGWKPSGVTGPRSVSLKAKATRPSGSFVPIVLSPPFHCATEV